MRRERLGVAEGANNERYESLRQKRLLHDATLESVGFSRPPTRKAARSNFQVTGQRFPWQQGNLCLFL